MIEYGITLDSEKVDDNELDTLFGALDYYVNTTKLHATSLDPMSLEYRSLEMATDIWLSSEFSYPNISSTGPNAEGYYTITESILSWQTTLTHAANKDVDNQPVGQVVAYLYGADAGKLASSAFKFRIGVYDGAVWTTLPTTMRHFGQGCGDQNHIYNLMVNSHYLENTPGYIPFNHARDRGIVLLASFGGEVRNSATPGVQKVAVMCQATAGISVDLVDGVIFLCARENV